MTLDQRRRLAELSYQAAMLISELREDRAASADKAKVRGVLIKLEKAHSLIDLAVGRAAQPAKKGANNG